MRILCPECGTVRDADVVPRDETYVFKGESITVPHEISVCSVCGTEVATAQQADSSLIAIREAYRSRHDLISPEEIRTIRKRYGAGQKPFGLILGLGESTIANYERGELPTTANSNLIRLMDDLHSFRQLFEERRELIGPTQRRRIEERLNGRGSVRHTIYEGVSVREEADEYTGFRQPDVSRIEALLGIVLERLGKPVHKTKLLKLCYIIDFEHFRHNTVSVTGWSYARLPHGPVLQDYKQLLEDAERRGIIQSEDFDDGTTVLRPGAREHRTDDGVKFDEDELATIDRVLERWSDTTAKELSDYTHRQPAWLQTDHAKEISYVLAFETKP